MSKSRKGKGRKWSFSLDDLGLGKGKLDPETVRMMALVWGGAILLIALIVFGVILVTLTNRNRRLAEATATAAAVAGGELTVTPTVEESAGDTTGTPAPAGENGTPTVTPANTPANPGLGGRLELGGQIASFITTPDVINSAGMTWIKYQIKWNPALGPSLARDMVNDGHRYGYKVLISISGNPYPQQTIDYLSYIAFLEDVASYGPDAIEVWNEMNLDREWPAGQIDPEAYVDNMLQPAYTAIKAISPTTDVIIGALAPTGVDNGTNAWSDDHYVAGLAAAGAAQYADCIGVHHNSGTVSPSVRTGRPEGEHYSWYFLPTVEIYYEGMNETLPVCITELGYLTPDGFSTPLPDTFAWGADTTVEEQAEWLAEAVDISQELGYVSLVIVWNVDFTRWDDDPQGGYAIIRPDGTCPACAALSRALAD
jgi:hypothetical protein